MSEPTREKIKEAFKETIKRWEKIVENSDYFTESSCSLCRLENIVGDLHQRCNDSCPIVSYGKEDHLTCVNTPYSRFYETRKRDDAIAELNFLREVYIWWIEREEKDVKCEAKGEKKEEWVDVTEELSTKILACGDGYTVYFSHDDRKLGFADNDGVFLDALVIGCYKLRKDDTNFTFLKKS